MKISLVPLLSVLGFIAFGARGADTGSTKVWNFNDVATGKLPAKWETMSALSSAGKKPGSEVTNHAAFAVVETAAQPANKALKMTPLEVAVYDDGHHCWTREIAFTDGTLSARVMAEDKTKGHCGFAFRIKDQQNFYAVRFAINEGNVSLVRVKDGVPTWPKTKISTGEVKGDHQWFDLKVQMSGATLTVWLQGKEIVQYTDPDPLAGPGGVGLFSRGKDSVVLWDDFTVTTGTPSK